MLDCDSVFGSLLDLNPLNVAWILVAAFSTSGSLRSISAWWMRQEDKKRLVLVMGKDRIQDGMMDREKRKGKDI